MCILPSTVLLLFSDNYKLFNNRDRYTRTTDTKFIFHSRSYDTLHGQAFQKINETFTGSLLINIYY